MKLSIVATLYRSAPHLREFHQRATQAASALAGNDYEIVLVNDGSPDNSLDMAVELTKQDPHVVVVDLSRNFGHHKAMLAGLTYARGERVFLIDSDLEEEPEWLGDFAQTMARESADVIYGVQEYPPRQNSCRLHRSTPGAAMKDKLGSIRTDIQRQSGSAVAAAGERSDRRGCAGDWDRCRHLGALARAGAVQARPRAGLDRGRPA